jgi:hypothetical protein
MLKPIPNFPGYLASSSGEIYSTQVGAARRLKKRLMKDGRRYVVALQLQGKSKPYTVAPLILSAFVSSRPSGLWACHGPRGSLIDSLDNLYWATPKRNAADRKRDGTETCGEKQGQHRLNTLQVRIILRSYSAYGRRGLTTSELANIFSVSQAHISRIVLRQSWRHLI